jgi:hypothetical protein
MSGHRTAVVVMGERIWTASITTLLRIYLESDLRKCSESATSVASTASVSATDWGNEVVGESVV